MKLVQICCEVKSLLQIPRAYILIVPSHVQMIIETRDLVTQLQLLVGLKICP